MEQETLKKHYDAFHSNDETTVNYKELHQKLDLIIGGAKLTEIKELKNEKTGEVYYTRCK